jgi:hypothetical protein
MGKDGIIIGLEKATLKRLPEEEALELWNDMHIVVSASRVPMIAGMIDKNSGYIRALVEAVNDNSKQGYGGLAADGNELTLQLFTPEDFHVSGDDTLPHYSGWQRWQTAPGIETFIGSTTGEEEGLVILGFCNPVSAPVSDAIKIYKGTEESVVEPLNWLTDLICCKAWNPLQAAAASGVSMGGTQMGWEYNEFYGGGSRTLPIAELRKPLLIEPETPWHIDVKYMASGSDALTPIGFRVRTAQAAWNLAF